jgi:DNA-binding CsgD family transcriptional regulator
MVPFSVLTAVTRIRIMIPAHILPKPEDERAEAERASPNVQESRPSGIRPKETRKIRARWTIVKTFVREGRHYQLRSRPLEVRGHDADLSKREEQVLACALSGQTNKSIAYTLGVAPSTVGVLLFRAATKLGAKSRSELLSAYARRNTSPSESAPDSESIVTRAGEARRRRE